jgi:hypothetical protein
MLRYGYHRGLPPGTETAWGCRTIVDQSGRLDVPPDRQGATGPHVDALLDHLNHHVRGAWHERAAELLRNGVMYTRRAGEFTLYRDSTVVIKGNTNASAGYLYVCSYLLPHCQAFARGDTGAGTCDQPLDENGQCPQASDHSEGGS